MNLTLPYVKVAVIDPEAPNASAVMEEARKFMISTFYKEAVVPLALGLTDDNDEMRRVFSNYRMVHLVAELCLLISNKKFCHIINSFNEKDSFCNVNKRLSST